MVMSNNSFPYLLLNLRIRENCLNTKMPKKGVYLYVRKTMFPLREPSRYILRQSASFARFVRYNWSSAGRSFVMRSLNPCLENFDQNLVV